MISIVFLIESLHLGGAEKSLVTLLKNLDYTKYQVDLITFQKEGFFLNEVPANVNQIVLQRPKMSAINRFRFFVRRKLNHGKYHHAQLLWGVVSNHFSLFEKQYDVAIAYNQGFATYYVSTYLKAHKKFAWINIDYQKANYNIKFDYPLYKKFDKIIAVSPEVAGGLANELNVNGLALPIEIIKDITDRDILEREANKPLKIEYDSSKINITSVGRLATQKGFYLAIQSCKILVDRGYDINWYVVGEGEQRVTLQKLIDENSLQKNFKLIGADINPYPYMKACDIYVQTSLFEGLGLTVIEASYLNKPIVSTNFPTIHGIIEEEETGLIAEMDKYSIADQVERLIVDVSLKEKLVSNLSKRINHDKDLTLIKVNNLFNI